LSSTVLLSETITAIYDDDDDDTTGHGQSVTCAGWSHSGKLLITSSDDKTASVWSLGTLDPIMTFSTAVHNGTSDASDKVNNVLIHIILQQYAGRGKEAVVVLQWSVGEVIISLSQAIETSLCDA